MIQHHTATSLDTILYFDYNVPPSVKNAPDLWIQWSQKTYDYVLYQNHLTIHVDVK